LQLLCGWVVLTIVWIGLGTLLTGPLAGGVIVRADERVANWMIAQRTPTWDHVTVLGSLLAETTTKVVVTAVLAVVFLWLWRRWFEPVFLVVSLVIEAAAFIVVTTVVGRDRPDVPRLDSSPVGSSFPSGHVAAAAAYAAIAVVVFLHTRKRWARILVVLVSVLVPVIVALSRMYRGMHFLSDTIAGAVLGCAAVALTAVVLARSPEGAVIVNPTAEAGGPTADALESAESDRIVA
jgi:undecaprenyl-diphosphatase